MGILRGGSELKYFKTVIYTFKKDPSSATRNQALTGRSGFCRNLFGSGCQSFGAEAGCQFYHDAFFVDVFGADRGDAFGAPAHEYRGMFVGQSGHDEACGEGAAQVVNAAVEVLGLCAVEDGAEAVFGPWLFSCG